MSRVFLYLVSAVLLSAACGGGGSDDDTGGSAGQGQSGSGGSRAEAGGASGSGGSSTSGSSGKAGGGGMSGGSAGVVIPRPTGTMGAAVECGSTAGQCTGTACCRAITGWSCVNDFDDCACSVEGRCTAVGCDEPADCNGGRCCGLVNPRSSPGYVASSCKAECEAGEREVCVTDDDCLGSDTCNSGTEFDWCF